MQKLMIGNVILKSYITQVRRILITVSHSCAVTHRTVITASYHQPDSRLWMMLSEPALVMKLQTQFNSDSTGLQISHGI